VPLKGVLKAGAEFLHAHARARLFVLFFWRRKKIGRLSGETDGRWRYDKPKANTPSFECFVQKLSQSLRPRLSDSPDRRTVFCLAKKAVKKAPPLRALSKLNAAFQGGGQTRQVTLAQTMSAFTLEKPRPLGTRKRGFESTEFNGQIS
jgi:hypothetical protein